MREGMWVAVLALALVGCSSSGTTKISSKALCENTGGQYVQGRCQPGTSKTAQDMCLGFGGFLMVNEDLCHIPAK